MNNRLKLSEILNAINGVKKAYFQPPASVNMVYPCIVYKLDGLYTRNADDLKYRDRDKYMVTVIDPDPDSNIWRDVLKTFRYCSFVRRFTADNLNHTVLSLYF